MNRRNKILALTALFLSFVMILASCGSSSSGGGSQAGGSGQPAASGNTGAPAASGGETASGEPNVLRFAYFFQDMDSLDVHKYTTTDVIQPAMTMGEPLMRIDGEGINHPLLLESVPEMSEDGTLFTCKLKEGVMFHDGTELTSADVEYTFNRIFDPATQNMNTWLCDMIKGGPEMLEGKADTLEGLKVLDKYSFTIELSEPYAPFLAVLACEQMMIYPKEACEAAGSNWGLTSFVGTGPFELVEFSSKDFTRVKRFDGYHGTPALLDELYIYSMDQNTAVMEYEAGTLDIVRVDPDIIVPYQNNEYANQILTTDLHGIIALNMNVNMAPLNDVRVREAISYAIDQNTLCAGAMQGNANPTYSLIPPAIVGHSDRPTNKYNPDKAKQLLADAGYPNGIDMETYVVEGDPAATVMVTLQEQFKASGINVKVNLVDRATYIDMRRAGEVQLPVLTWYRDIADPDNFTYTFYHSTASQRFSSNWNDAKTDEMLAKGRASSGQERIDLYVDLEKYLVEEQFVVVPLYNPIFFYLQRDNVDGIFFDNSLLRFDASTAQK